MKRFLALLLIMLSVFSFALAENNYSLPLDISVGGFTPKGVFTPTTYEDESLSVHIDEILTDKQRVFIAYFTVKSPTQLRTAMAGAPNSMVTALPSRMGKKLNAVLVVNGEFYVQRTHDTIIYRQGEMIRNEPDPLKDVLIIDEAGDFHIFTSENKKEEIEAYKANGGSIVNAFSFGPAYVVDGVPVTPRENYYFTPNEHLSRTVIAQVDELSYAFVMVEGIAHDKIGFTQKEMADFLATMNFKQAYALDGGQSTVMLFNRKYVGRINKNTERAQSDIVYVVSAVPD